MAYESAEQTITAGGTLTLAHGLGAIPKFASFRLVCKTADAGYAVGDQIFVPQVGQIGANMGVVIRADATNLYIKFGSNLSGAFEILNNSTGNAQQIANATNWTVIFTAGIL